MPKYRWLESEPKTLALNGRSRTVEPGDIVEIPAGLLVQTGDHGEPAQWEQVEDSRASKATSNDGKAAV